MKHTPWLILAALLSVTGCQCQCGNTVVVRNDGGTGGGTTSQGDGGTGGGAQGGGSATGGGGGSMGFDAGDGTTIDPIGPGMFTLDGGAGGYGDGVKLDPNGYVVLNQGSAEFYFMWIANDANGWVSKYDTRTGKEVGRYWSVIPKDCANSVAQPCAGGVVHNMTSADVWHPSRTALDLNGDVFVANRGIGKQGSVTKIANAPYSCIDRNNNGTIETSRDINGDGQISMTPSDGEMIFPSNPADPNTYDECVLFTKPIGATVAPDVAARALAVSAGAEGSAGDVWVGLYFEQRVYKMSSANGELMPVSPGGPNFLQLNFGPYGAIVDRLQRLWVVEPGVAHLALIDTGTGTILSQSINGSSTGCGAYGLGIDARNRVWLPGWSQGAIACRYDHTTGTWTKFDFSAARSQTNSAFGMGRGIAIDTGGRVYMSGYGGSTAQLIRFDAETGAIIPFAASQFIDMSDANTGGSIGVGLDADGHPWVNNYSGNVTKVDQMTGAITRTAQQPGGLYTYSDFTGYQLRNFTAPRGTYRRDFEACANDNQWRELTWDAVVPANSTLQVFVKAANTVAELNATTLVRYGPFTTSPVDLIAAGVPQSRFLRVEFVLRSVDGQTSPVLRGFNVKWLCGGIN